MKLFLTITFLFCSILFQEQGMASLSTGMVQASGNCQKRSARPMLLSFIQSSRLTDQLPCCDEDDELSDNKRKIQWIRSTNNDPFSIQDYLHSVTGSCFLNNIYWLPGTDKCIFQRVLRV